MLGIEMLDVSLRTDNPRELAMELLGWAIRVFRPAMALPYPALGL